MTKKTRGKRGGKSTKSSGFTDRTTVIGSAVYVPSPSPTTGAILNLTPTAIGGPASNTADNYTSYNISKVEVTINPLPAGTAGGYVVVGVSVNVTDATATGFSAQSLYALPHRALIVPTATVPRKFTVPSSYLIRDNAVKAVKTVAGSPSDWDEIFAQLFVATTTAAVAVTIEVKVWFNFMGLVPTVLTPAPAHTQREISLIMVVAKMEKYNACHSDSHMEPFYDVASDIWIDVIKSGPFHLGSFGVPPPVVPLIPRVVPPTADPHAVELLKE